MAKTVQIYNTAGLFVGPAPSTGYHFITQSGVLNNNDSKISELELSDNINLVFPINRVYSVNYELNAPRVEIKNLGKFSNISNSIINPPEINLNFDYYVMGLINEARMGFLFNHVSGNYITGNTIFNSYVCPISGFIDRTYERTNYTEQRWPLSYRDSRNIFIAIRKDNDDLNYKDETSNYNNLINVLAFGDCYINSYQTSAAVNDFAKASVQYSCNNILYYSTNSGETPSVNPKNFNLNSGINFIIPNNYEGSNLPTVILPRDITIDIRESHNQNPRNLIFDYNDIKIQSYNINLTFNREPLNSLGYKLPLDKRIKFPVLANLSFSLLIGDLETGSLENLIKKDVDYNINIKLKYQSNKLFTDTAIRYDFLKAKFENISFNQSIQNKKIASLVFSTEINPINISGGFFISGQLGVPRKSGNAVFLGDDFYGDGLSTLLYENGDRFLLYNDTYSIIY